MTTRLTFGLWAASSMSSTRGRLRSTPTPSFSWCSSSWKIQSNGQTTWAKTAWYGVVYFPCGNFSLCFYHIKSLRVDCVEWIDLNGFLNLNCFLCGFSMCRVFWRDCWWKSQRKDCHGQTCSITLLLQMEFWVRTTMFLYNLFQITFLTVGKILKLNAMNLVTRFPTNLILNIQNGFYINLKHI